MLKFKKLMKASECIVGFPLLLILGGTLFIKIVTQSSFFDILNEFLFNSHIVMTLPIIFICIFEILLISYSLYLKKFLNGKKDISPEKTGYLKNLLVKVWIVIFALNFCITSYFCWHSGIYNTFSLYLIICTLAILIGGILASTAFKSLLKRKK